MPPNRYRVFQWGGPVAATATAPHYVYVVGVAKAANANSPWAVVNEVLCGHLGRTIGLPIPPGFVVSNGTVPYHVSMDFNLAGQGLPPVIPPAFANIEPDLAWGIVYFDIWIVNGDRHAGNLARFDATAECRVFDHSHAFWPGVGGVASLAQHAGSLGIGTHCLLPHLADTPGAASWRERIEAVPDFVIMDAVAAARDVGLPAADAAQCADFLKQRRDGLRVLTQQCAGQFPPAVQHLL